MMTKYVSIEAPRASGKKAQPAQITACFSSKKQAENKTSLHETILTEKQAKKFIERWNSEFEDGNYSITF